MWRHHARLKRATSVISSSRSATTVYKSPMNANVYEVSILDSGFTFSPGTGNPEHEICLVEDARL
jgi:hypothetical protein